MSDEGFLCDDQDLSEDKESDSTRQIARWWNKKGLGRVDTVRMILVLRLRPG